LNTNYYGFANENWSSSELIDQLESYNIDYFIFKEGIDKRSDDLKRIFPEITNGSIKGIEIFKIS
jgi:hypothetical protein